MTTAHRHPRNGRSPSRAPAAVAVLGATTALGQQLCARFLADPAIRFVLAVGREELDPGLPRSSRLIYRRVDLTRERETRELLFGPAKELGVDVVVHLAMHRELHAGSRTHLQNVEALRWLLAAAERHPTVRRVVLRSHAEVYLLENHLANLIAEDHPLDLSPGAPQWLRDRVEADLLACSRAGADGLEIAVLRCAELPAPGVGSQLYEMLSAPVCLRPAGFDPMLNLLSMEDAADAFDRAVRAWGVEGPINIAGADTLPLTECIRLFGARCVPLPGPVLGPVNRLRRALQGGSFSYHLNARRLHVAAVLDGARARALLGYEPRHPLRWPGQANGHIAAEPPPPTLDVPGRHPEAPGAHA